MLQNSVKKILYRVKFTHQTKNKVLFPIYIFLILSGSSHCKSVSVKNNKKLINAVSLKSKNQSYLDPIEYFFGNYIASIKSKYLCLISNQSGLARFVNLPSSNGKSYLQSQFEKNGSKLKIIFTPEHGISAQEEEFGNHHHRKKNIRVDTLYKMFVWQIQKKIANCNDIIFDLPDSGVRPYTYRTIMLRTMRAISKTLKKKKNITFYILDRPNPARGHGIHPPFAIKRYFTSIGEQHMPFMPQVTQAEMAKLYYHEKRMKFEMKIFKLKNYKGSLRAKQSQYIYPPSPSLPTYRSTMCYWTGVLLETTVLHEGRNTNDPFCLTAHPNFHYKLKLPKSKNYYWEIFRYKPYQGRYSKKMLNGFRLRITNYNQVNMNKIAYNLLLFFKKTFPKKRIWKKYKKTYAIDELTGTNLFRKAIEQELPYRRWLQQNQNSIEQFKNRIRPHLIYQYFWSKNQTRLN